MKERNDIMAVLATPKKNSYVVKKAAAEKIVKSKTSKAYEKNIKERANAFKANNLKMN